MSELPISSVTVHRDGAIVTRSGRLTSSSGRARATRLPLLLDERSLRIRVVGARLRDVRLELDLEGVDRAMEPAHETALRAADHAVRRLEAEEDALRERRSSLAALAPAKPGSRDLEAPPPERVLGWLLLDGPVQERLAAIDDRLRRLQLQLREARDARQVAIAAAQAASSESWWRRWAPTRAAALGVDADGELEVELSYRIDGACWTPTYALYADAALRRARFAVSALVAQATGEDWRGVRLSLSTAPCQRTIDVPELKALRLGKASPPAPSPWRDLPPGLDELFPPGLEAPAPAPAPAWASGAAPTVVAEVALDDVAPYEEPAPEPPARRRLPSNAPVGTRSAPAAPPAGAPMPNAPMPQGLALPVAAAPMAKKSIASPVSRALMAPLAAGAAVAEAAAGAFGGGGAADEYEADALSSLPEPQPAPLDVDMDKLDYPHLRLEGYEAPWGVRGRLQRLSPSQEAAAAGLPHAGVAALDARMYALRARVDALSRQPLPAHHVLPGPIEGADFRFDAGDAVDVAADGRYRAVALDTEEIDLDVRYRAVPRLDPRAFRTVRAVLKRPTPLLGGPVDVHVDGALVLTAPWRGSPRGGELVIGLGVEDGLRVARNVRYREESAGLIGGSRRLHTDVEVEIASSLSRVAEVEILDRVPITKDDEVRVELAESSPPSEKWTGDEGDPILEGGRRQVVVVAAGGKAKATLKFTTTMSAKLELQGGDRRG